MITQLEAYRLLLLLLHSLSSCFGSQRYVVHVKPKILSQDLFGNTVQNYSCCILLDIFSSSQIIVIPLFRTKLMPQILVTIVWLCFLREPPIAINSSKYLRFPLLQLAELGVGSYWSGLVWSLASELSSISMSLTERFLISAGNLIGGSLGLFVPPLFPHKIWNTVLRNLGILSA